MSVEKSKTALLSAISSLDCGWWVQNMFCFQICICMLPYLCILSQMLRTLLVLICICLSLCLTLSVVSVLTALLVSPASSTCSSPRRKWIQLLTLLLHLQSNKDIKSFLSNVLNRMFWLDPWWPEISSQCWSSFVIISFTKYLSVWLVACGSHWYSTSSTLSSMRCQCQVVVITVCGGVRIVLWAIILWSTRIRG